MEKWKLGRKGEDLFIFFFFGFYQYVIIKLIISEIEQTEMQKSESEQERSPQHVGEGAVKSQKNITITVPSHTKTQNDRGQDDHQRSPDAGRSDMRQTWRKPRIPYNKLRDLYSQQKQKTQHRYEDRKYIGKVREDLIQHLDKMVENSQYKQTQKYLEPLKFKQEDKKKQSTDNRNPLNPVKKVIKMVNKAREFQDLSVQFINKTAGPNISQYITLEIIKRSHNTGKVKKMLHVPTMTLVCIREEPFTQKQSRNSIRDCTNLWREKLSGEGMPFVAIYHVLYTYPEGASSIIMEYFKSRSLLNLLDETATLPQSVIREIFIQVLKALQIFYTSTNMHFGGIAPSQIMFTSDNKIKMSLESYNLYTIKTPQKNNIFDFRNSLTGFMKNNQIDKSLDIFKIGMCMLQCAIGSFENFQQSSLLFEAVKYIFTEQGQKLADVDKLCCIFHSEAYLLQLNPMNGQSQKTQRRNQDRYISYLKLLKDRFSIHFINFLCICLKLQHSQRATFSSIVQHTYITSPHDNENRTVKVDLASMLAICRGWNQVAYQSKTQQNMNSFVGHVKTILEYCSKEALNQLYTVHQGRLYSLGKEVGLDAQVLGTRLEKIIGDILKNGK